MNCKNCNTPLNQGEKFCPVCGAPVVQTQTQYEQNINQYQPNNNQTNFNAQPNNNYNINQPNINMNYDETLINAYIGKNTEKLKYGGFSINTLCFGPIYVFYRKMWLLGLLWMIGTILVGSILGIFGYIMIIAANILISGQFKKWYLEHVQKQIYKIKYEHPGANQDQLIMLCNKKGGTTIWPIIVLVVIYVLLIILATIAVTTYLNNARNSYSEEKQTTQEVEPIEDPEEENSSQADNNKIDNLKYNIPSVLKAGEYNTDTYKSYSLVDMDDYCSATISTVNNYMNHKTAKEYLKEEVYYSASDKVSPISNKQINGAQWYTMSVTTTYNTSYYYATIYNNKVYEVEYEITDDTGVCSKAHTSFINSLNFQG